MKKRSISITQQGEYIVECSSHGFYNVVKFERLDGEPMKVGEHTSVVVDLDTFKVDNSEEDCPDVASFKEHEPYSNITAQPPLIPFAMRVHKYDDSGNKKVSVMSAIDYIFPTNWEFI